MTRMPPPSASRIAAEALPAFDAAPGRAPAPGAAEGRGAAPRPARLLLLTDTSISVAGGSERFLRNLVAGLPRERYRITVVQFIQGDYSGKRMAVDADHVELVDMPVGAVYGRAGRRAFMTLRDRVRSGHYDIVQSQHEKSDLINALLPRVPGTLHLSCRRDMGFNKSPRLKWLFRFLNHRFDAVIAPSQPILAGLARTEALDPRGMLWIPNGVDAARFRPFDEAHRRAVRKSLGLDDDTVAFCCLARLSWAKCHGDLLDAFAQVRQRLPRARLFLVGDGPAQAEVEARMQAPDVVGAVTLLGLRLDVETLLPAFDAGVLASSTEGMSNAVLEMMACGLPVVATAVGGNPALVEHGISGSLVPARQPDALAAALVAVAADAEGRRRMGNAARARIERMFSVSAMVDAYDHAYQRLLADA